MTAISRSEEITASSIRHAADVLEHAFSELAAAQHNAETTPELSGVVDVYDALELGAEPEQMVARLRALAEQILNNEIEVF